VMAERAAELEEVGPSAQVKRGEGVAKGVKARPGALTSSTTGLRCRRRRLPYSKTLPSLFVKTSAVESGPLAQPGVRAAGGERSGQRHLAPAVFRLWRLDPTADDDLQLQSPVLPIF
jgi:hypothetical protein